MKELKHYINEAFKINKNTKLEKIEILDAKTLCEMCFVFNNEYLSPHYDKIFNDFEELLEKLQFANFPLDNFKIEGIIGFEFQKNKIVSLLKNESNNIYHKWINIWQENEDQYYSYQDNKFDTMYSSHKIEIRKHCTYKREMNFHIYINGSSLGFVRIIPKRDLWK